jgi:hypothetical protein
MNQYNHWKQSEIERKRKDTLDLVIFYLLIGGVLITWIL